MSTFWLKIAALAVVIIVAFVGITMMMSPAQDKPAERSKTIYDTAEQDRKELLAEPGTKDFAEENKETETQTPDENQPTEETETTEAAEPQPQEPLVLYFKPLSEIEKIEAERLLQTVPSFRSIGRMPFTGYGAMVQSCRQIISRFKGSIYDYKARRALAQIPERYRRRYDISDDEIKLDYFTVQRPGTQPYEVKVTEEK